MKIVKLILKIIIKIFKFVLSFPLVLMQPKYMYDIDEAQKEIEEIIK